MTLGHIFAKPKDPVKTNQKTHAVYSIPCGDCEKEYLGQSKRQFGTRLKEHQKAVSTLDKGKSEHVCYTKHEIAWENSKVITTNNRYTYMSNTNANVQWTYEMSIGHMTVHWIQWTTQMSCTSHAHVQWTCTCPMDISNDHWIFECQLDPMAMD